MSASPTDGSAPSGDLDPQQHIRFLSGVGLPNGSSGGKSSTLPVSSSISATSLGVVPRGGGGGGVLFPGGLDSVPSSISGRGGAVTLPPPPTTRLSSFQTPVGGGSGPYATRSSLTTSSPPIKSEEPPTPLGVKSDALLSSEDDAPLYGLYWFDGDFGLICGAVVASGGQVCCALPQLCRFQHLKKSQVPPGYYIKSHNQNGAFYVEPYLPLDVAEASTAFMRIVNSGVELPLAKWSSLFATVLEGKLDEAVVEDVMEEESEISQTPSTPSLKKPRFDVEGGDTSYSLLAQLWRKQAQLEGRVGLSEKEGDHATLCAALRSAHQRISELEGLLKTFESRLVAAQCDATAAHDKANLVQSNGLDMTKAAAEFERIAGSKYADVRRVSALETHVDQLKKDIAETNGLVVKLWNAVNDLMRGGTATTIEPPQGGRVTQADYNMLLKRVVEVEKKQGSLTYSVGGRTFSCQEDANIWAAQYMPPDSWDNFVGLMHLMNLPNDVTALASETVTEQLQATKTGLSTFKIAAITSYKATYPQQLTGTSKASTTATTETVGFFHLGYGYC